MKDVFLKNNCYSFKRELYGLAGEPVKFISKSEPVIIVELNGNRFPVLRTDLTTKQQQVEEAVITITKDRKTGKRMNINSQQTSLF
jgi:hypothetical protein